MTAINATLEVDFLGQCASESLGSNYWSSSGGQPDFARGAVMAEHGQAFIVLHSTTADEAVSRIVPQLQPGAAVTTFKNIVDKVVTEYGVAELRGRSIAERTRRLIGVAHPKFREQLTAEARGARIPARLMPRGSRGTYRARSRRPYPRGHARAGLSGYRAPTYLTVK